MKLCISTCLVQPHMTLSDLQPVYSRCHCADCTFPNLSLMEVASLPLRDTRSLLEELGIHRGKSRTIPFQKIPNSTRKEQCVLKNQATVSSHHLCHWLLQCPGWKEINPPAKSKLSSRFGH